MENVKFVQEEINVVYKLDVCIYVLEKTLRKEASELKEILEKNVSDCSVKTCPHLNNKWNISETRQHFLQCKEKYDVKSTRRCGVQLQQSTLLISPEGFVAAEEAEGMYRHRSSTTKRIATSITTKNLGDLVDLIIPHKVTSSPAAQPDSHQPRENLLSVDEPFDERASQVSVSPDKSVDSSSPHVDVVVIFGHCSMYNCGPFSTDELLAALIKVNPTIIAFLGCCGGSNRYGPILKMMHALNPKCIVGFYQRRVYVDELQSTSLVDGLKKYLYLTSNDPKLARVVAAEEETKMLDEAKTDFAKQKRAIAVHAFGYAQSFLGYENFLSDPTRFANSNSETNLHQALSNAGVDKSDIISLPCLQLAIYHQMVVNSKMKPINISIESIIKGLNKNFTCEKFNQECINQIRAHQIHKLIPLICELVLLKLHKESLFFIKEGEWMNVDHLQFLLAMLRGYWGMNSLTVIRKWATFHLVVMMIDTLNDLNNCLHKYKLCCVCYALLSENHFVRFVESSDETHYCFGILACEKFLQSPAKNDYLYDDVTHATYINTKTRKYRDELPSPIGTYPDKGELNEYNWVELFQHCSENDGCVKVYNDETEHTTWDISNYGGQEKYPYKHRDFMLALHALSDFLAGKITKTRRVYSTSDKFKNKTDKYWGHMKFFDPPMLPLDIQNLRDLSFVEMSVITEPKELDKTNNANLWEDFKISFQDDVKVAIEDHRSHWEKVSSCRFVFAIFNNPATISKLGVNLEVPHTEAILYYTDSHYGHCLINFDNLNQLHSFDRSPSCWYASFKKQIDCCDGYHLRKKLCYPCKYAMLQLTVKEMLDGKKEKQFPFECIGKLELKTLANENNQQKLHATFKSSPATKY